METIPYNPELHKSYIRNWLEIRGLRISMIEELPKTGYITSGALGPIAAGFIRMVEGGFGILDSLITNPQATPQDRDAAIDLVVENLILKAKELKLSALIATTSDNHTLLRSSKHGFVQLPHTAICLDLSPQAQMRNSE